VGTLQVAAFMPDGNQILFSTSECVTKAVPFEPRLLLEAAQRARALIPAMPPAYRKSYKARVGDNR
jgi:hypothetical protein